MKRNILRTLLAVAALAITQTMAAQEQYTIDLWENGPAVASTDVADTARIVVYLPKSSVPGRRCVLILPGGGYTHLAMDYEGLAWAPYFNSMGIAAVVLKYRMPHGEKLVPISDVEEALRVIRAHADEWGINPDDVGIMGSSAGGHLATTIATHSPAAIRPAFQILCYPVVSLDPAITHRGSRDNFLGEAASSADEQQFSNATQVSAETPRAIIMLSSDDGAVLPANGIGYYEALLAHGVPAALMVYPSGGHGWGMRTTFLYHADMLMNLRSWLSSF